MPFNDYEISPYSGTPERLFLFESGNQQWAYTNQSRDTVRGSITYTPEVIAMDNIVQNLGEGPPTITITMAASATVAQQFVPYQPIFPMMVSVFRRHRDDPSGEYIIEMMGDAAGVGFDEEDGTCQMQCRMVTSNFKRKTPWLIYQPQCNYALYGTGCKVNPDDYKVVTAISDVQQTDLYAPGFATKPDQWFRGGFIRRDLTGEIRFVVGHIGNRIILQTPFVDLNVEDTVSIFAGCDRLFSTCKAKFNNGHRFIGHQWIPQKNPFRDNVYGTGTSGGGGGSAWKDVVGKTINTMSGG